MHSRGHRDQVGPNRRQASSDFNRQRCNPLYQEDLLANQSNANNRPAKRNQTVDSGDLRAQLTPSNGFDAPAANEPGGSNYQDQDTEEQVSPYNRRRPASWVTQKSEYDDLNLSDSELERGEYLYNRSFGNTDGHPVSVPPPTIFDDNHNVSPASVDPGFRAFRYPREVGTNLRRPAASRRLSSIKSRSGSVGSTSRRRRFNVKAAANKYWKKIGPRHENKPAAPETSVSTATQSDNFAAQPSGVGSSQPALEPLPESVGTRIFSGASRPGLYPPYRNLPSAFFEDVYHDAGEFSSKQRASLPPKAKRRFTDRFKALNLFNRKSKKEAKLGKASDSRPPASPPVGHQGEKLGRIQKTPQPVSDSLNLQAQAISSCVEGQFRGDYLHTNTPELINTQSSDTERQDSRENTPTHSPEQSDSGASIDRGYYWYEGPPSSLRTASARSSLLSTPLHSPSDGAGIFDSPELQVRRASQKSLPRRRRQNSANSNHFGEPESFDSHDQSSPHKNIGRLNDQLNTSDAAEYSSPSQASPQQAYLPPSHFISDFDQLYQEALHKEEKAQAELLKKCVIEERSFDWNPRIQLLVTDNKEYAAAETLRTGQLVQSAYDLPPDSGIDPVTFEEKFVLPLATAELRRSTYLRQVEKISREIGAPREVLAEIQKEALKGQRRLSRQKSLRTAKRTPAAQRLLLSQGHKTTSGSTSPARSSPLARRQFGQDSRLPKSSRAPGFPPPTPLFSRPSVDTCAESSAVRQGSSLRPPHHGNQVVESQRGFDRDLVRTSKSKEPQTAAQRKFGVSLKSVPSVNSGADSSVGVGPGTVESRDHPAIGSFGVELKPVRPKDQQDSESSFVSARSREQQTSSSTGQGERTGSGQRTFSGDAVHPRLGRIPEGRERESSNETQQNRRLRDLSPKGGRIASNESEQNSRGPLSPSLRKTLVAELAKKFGGFSNSGEPRGGTGDKVVRDQAGARAQSKVSGDVLPQSGGSSKEKQSSFRRDSQEKVASQTPAQAPGQDQGEATGTRTSDVPASVLRPGKLDPARGRSSKTPPVSGSRLPRPVQRLTPAIGARLEHQQIKHRHTTVPKVNNQRYRGPEINVNPSPSQSRIQPPTLSGRSVAGTASNFRSLDSASQNSRDRTGAKLPFLGNRPQ